MITRRSFLTLTASAMLMTYANRSAAVEPAVPPMLDHILLGCSDLDAGIAFVELHTGVAAVIGGVHPGRGTRNALLSLGKLHYLEIIAPDPAQSSLAAGPSSMLGKLRHLDKPRIITWAAHTSDIEALAAQLRKAGVAISGPTPGSRKRPDGRLLSWQTLNPENDRDGLLPFFIQWGAGSIHPSIDAPAGCRLNRFGSTSPNPRELSAAYQQLGLEVQVKEDQKSALHAEVVGPGAKLRLSS